MTTLQKLKDKITTPDKINTLFKSMRGKHPLVTTNGCFDLLHLGHLHILSHCASLSPYTVVLINNDLSVKTLKGPKRPIQNEQTRSILLASLSFVWRVVIFSEPTPIKCLEIIKPDIHVKGADYKDQELPEAALMKTLGGKMEFFPILEGFSTTEICNTLK
jgi:rfaE bifunctional protein nucleotidyltransferase chain/domain